MSPINTQWTFPSPSLTWVMKVPIPEGFEGVLLQEDLAPTRIEEAKVVATLGGVATANVKEAIVGCLEDVAQEVARGVAQSSPPRHSKG